MGATGSRGLIAWQKAIELVEKTYRVTTMFPSTELHGLVHQLRRRAVSARTNIAERHARGDGLDFARFLRIAPGSTRELETQIIIAGRSELAPRSDRRKLLADSTEVRKIINGLIRVLELRLKSSASRLTTHDSPLATHAP